MIYDDWHVAIQINAMMHATDIYIYRKVTDKQIELITELSNPIKVETMEAWKITSPTISIPGFLGDTFLQAFADALDGYGIRAKAKPVLENELTAIKYHLEDMRKLVFKA